MARMVVRAGRSAAVRSWRRPQWRTGLVLVTDGQPAAGDAPSPLCLRPCGGSDRSAPAAYLVAATASEELAHTLEREGFFVLSLPLLPDEDGLAC